MPSKNKRGAPPKKKGKAKKGPVKKKPPAKSAKKKATGKPSMNIAALKKKMQNKQKQIEQQSSAEHSFRAGVQRVFTLMLNFGDLQRIQWDGKGLKEMPESIKKCVRLVFEFCGDVRQDVQTITKATLHKDFVKLHAGGKSAVKGAEYIKLFSIVLSGSVVHLAECYEMQRRDKLGIDVRIELFNDGVFQIIDRPDKMILNGRKINFDKPKYCVYRGSYEWFSEGIKDSTSESKESGNAVRFICKELLEIRPPDGKIKEATDSWVLIHGLNDILDRDCRLKEFTEVWEAIIDSETGQLRFRKPGETKTSRGMLGFEKTKHRIHLKQQSQV